MKKTLTTLIVMVAGISAMMIMTTATTVVLAQPADRTFESEEHRFRLHVPQGWVVQDVSGVQIYEKLLEATGLTLAAQMCKENEALPGIGGTYNCSGAQTTVNAGVYVYPDLQERSEFEILEEQNKTIPHLTY